MSTLLAFIIYALIRFERICIFIVDFSKCHLGFDIHLILAEEDSYHGEVLREHLIMGFGVRPTAQGYR